MYILGVSAYYHDSAACLVHDGVIVAAAQEERFSRKKHDHEFPRRAVAYCLAHAGIDESKLDLVVFYDKPLIKFERLLETYLCTAPRGLMSFIQAMPLWLRQKLWTRSDSSPQATPNRGPLPRVTDAIRKELPGYGGGAGKVLYGDHHESHAASAYYPSPFDEAAVLTIDGVGEGSTTTWGVGRGKDLTLMGEVRFPHSLGLLYSAFTYFTGFTRGSGAQ